MEEENHFYRQAVEAVITICINTNAIDPKIKVLLERINLTNINNERYNTTGKILKPSYSRNKNSTTNSKNAVFVEGRKAVENEERIYKCADCDLEFKRSSDIRRHERTHLRILPNICTHCGKGFARKDALKRHANTLTCNRNRQRLLSMGGNINEILQQAKEALNENKKS